VSSVHFMEEEWKTPKDEIKKLLSEMCKLPHAQEWLNQMTAEREGEATISDLKTLMNLKVASKNDATIVFLSCFLWAFEGYYLANLDWVCFILIKNGHDLFDPIRRKYVKSFKDLRNIDISTKFQFLEEHDFEALIRDQDRKLRNKIAHHSFSLLDNGELKVEDESLDISSRLNGLLDFTGQLVILRTKVLRELTEDMKS
jgi:hypothetical protein